MRPMRIALLAVILVALLTIASLISSGSGAGPPESGPPESASDGRFMLEKVEDGYLRLDTKTGALSFCREQRGEWACELTADERAQYEAEIARLREKIEEPGGRPSPGETAGGFPSEEELDEAMGFFEQMMKRMARMAQNLKEELEALEKELHQGQEQEKENPEGTPL